MHAQTCFFFFSMRSRLNTPQVRECIATTNCFAGGRNLWSILIAVLTVTGVLNIIGVFKYTRYVAFCPFFFGQRICFGNFASHSYCIFFPTWYAVTMKECESTPTSFTNHGKHCAISFHGFYYLW